MIKDNTNTTMIIGTAFIAGATALLWIAVPSTVKISIWTLIVIFGALFYLAGIAYVYNWRLYSPIIANPESKDSTNYSAPLLSFRGGGVFKQGLEVWGRHGFGSTLFAWRDSKYDIYSSTLAPKQMSPESKVFTTEATLQPINDNILNGIFHAIREGLMSTPTSFYKPKRLLGAFVAVLHYKEADYDKTQQLYGALSRGGLITPARRTVDSPEQERIKIMREMEIETKKKGFVSGLKSFLAGEQSSEDDNKEQERGREGFQP